MMTRKQLACREVVELITSYLDGALSRRDRKRFERHLAGCKGCTRYMAQLRTTITVVGRITEGSIPSPVMAELLTAFRGWKGAR
jgi:anti-sigma factor RsiW